MNYGNQPNRGFGEVVPYEEYSKQRRGQGVHSSATKGKLPVQDLSESLGDEENPYLISEESDEKQKRKVRMIKKTVLTLICLLASLGLNFLSFHLPLTPSIVTVDFSPFPELLTCIAVHPIAAVAVIIVKNILYYFVRPAAAASLPNKMLLDLLFVLTAWAMCCVLNRSPKKADVAKHGFSPVGVIIGGVVASLITALVSVLTFRYILVPLLLRQLGGSAYYPMIFENYRAAYAELTRRFTFVGRMLPTLDTMRAGIVVYNVPLFTFKYLISALLSVVLYPLINDYIER